MNLSTDSWQARRDDWELLIQRVFSESVYIAFASELHLHVDSLDWSGVFCPNVDLLIRESTPERWQGRRRAFVISNAALGNVGLTVDQVAADSLMIHELCHIFQNIAAEASENPEHKPAERGSKKQAEDVRRILSLRQDDEPADDGIPEYYWHGDDFIRLLAHAAFRVEAAGIELSDLELYHHSFYAVSPLSWYRHALGSEPEERAHLKITAAVAGDAPEAFCERWRHDLRRNHTPEARALRRKIRTAVAMEATR